MNLGGRDTCGTSCEARLLQTPSSHHAGYSSEGVSKYFFYNWGWKWKPLILAKRTVMEGRLTLREFCSRHVFQALILRLDAAFSIDHISRSGCKQ